ncbi:MAG: hypothetical protein M1818_004669 [Claussenomyces sp. TS43310]|nr:MAG: hypothetical protein M1818_004669 [Claussenomyces sp. TS43310]
MFSGQAHSSHRSHEIADFRSLSRLAPEMVSMEGLDMNGFLMDHNGHAQDEHGRPSGLMPFDNVSNTQFIDFSFPFQDAHGGGAEGLVDAKSDHSADPYNLSGRVSASEHRASITSLPMARASFSSNAPLSSRTRTASADGSDGASPESHRAGAHSGYADEFGLNDGGAGDGSDLGLKTREDKTGLTPAWSELKTKAGKERKRLPLACIACRRKKIRCSGEKPACKHCLRSRIPCVYKVTTRKAAPRTDYMAMLDKRLKRMEERIIKIVPKEGQEEVSSFTRAQVKPSIPGTVPVRMANGRKRAADEAFGPELDAWSKSNVTADAGLSSSLLQQEAEETRLLTEGAEALPSQEVQEHLAEVFFDNLYGQAYHLLHKPSFMRKLKTIPPVLILAVCAVSARLSTHPKVNTNPAFLRGEQWASEARKIVLRRYEWPNITILTCLLLLGLHEFGTCYGGRSWALGGMAIRMAYALQLHKDLDHDPCKRDGKTTLTFIDREIRRRTMWACFLMDRFNSSGTDRPMFIKEETLNLQLPIKEKFFQLEMEGPTEDLKGDVPRSSSSGEGQLSNATDNMGVAAYMIRAIAVWGRIITYLFHGGRAQDPHPIWHRDAQFRTFENQAESFASTLPDSLQYTKENLDTHETEGLANQFFFLHIITQGNMLFLNHIAAYGPRGGLPPKGTPTEFITNSATKSLDAAKQISEILRQAESFSVAAPFAGYCAFLSSTVQMAFAFSKNSTIEVQTKKNLATNVRYLAKLKRIWGAFHWTSESLKEQYKACADTAQHAQSGDEPRQVPYTLCQYGDWFDRYPYGVSHSDFEDPAVLIKKEKGDDAVLGQKSDCRTVEDFFSTVSPQQQDRDTAKTPKRKNARKVTSQPASQSSKPSNRNEYIPTSQPIQIPTQSVSHLPPGYQVSPTDTHANIYGQPRFYGQDFAFTPQHPSMLPQLDRQLVFGAYAGMDPSTLGHGPAAMNGTMGNWDMGLNDMTGLAAEPTSAWFMPFNLEPPSLGPDDAAAAAAAAFGSVGSASLGYDGMRGMPSQ